MSTSIPNAKPLAQLDEWDDFVEGRYKAGKSQEEFRVYDAAAQPGVAEFYRLNHEGQTVEYVLGKEREYFGLKKGMKTIWEAADFLNTLVDERPGYGSDPDGASSADFRSDTARRSSAVDGADGVSA